MPLSYNVEYESQACTPTGNTVCTKMAQCTRDEQYARVEATATSQRTCASTRQCSQGVEWMVKQATATSDRICQAFRVCHHFLAAPDCTKVAPAVDRGGSPDLPGDFWDGRCFESEPGTRLSPNVCRPVSAPCLPGEYEFAQPTASSDRACRACRSGQCTACQSGHYRVEERVSVSPGEVWRSYCRPVQPVVVGYTFEVKPPTPFSDRAVAACRVCSAGLGLFEAAPCTFDTDRTCSRCATGNYHNAAAGLCARCRVCTASEFRVATCSAGADTVCAACPEGMYVVDDEAPTAAAACKHFAGCNPNTEFETTVPGVSMPQCRALTECDSRGGAQYEVRLPSRTEDRVCGETTRCQVGQFQQRAPSSISDRRCGECDGVGEFQDEGEQADCKATTPCASDEFEAKPPTPTTDRVCEVIPWGGCTTGFFQSAPATTTSNRRCTACRPACAAFPAEVESVPCASFSDRACVRNVPCARGTFQVAAASATAARVCKPHSDCESTVEYAITLGTSVADTWCHPLTVCQPGQHVVAEHTATADRVCATCATGTWSSRANQAWCEQCTSLEGACEAGQQPSLCLPTRDSKCTACAAGKFGNSRTQGCTLWGIPCGPGTVETVAPSAVSDRVCAQCPAGSFRSPAMPACKAWSVCSSTIGVETLPGTPSTDRLCSVEQQAAAPTAALPRVPAAEPDPTDAGRNVVAGDGSKDFDWQAPIVIITACLLVLCCVSFVIVCCGRRSRHVQSFEVYHPSNPYGHTPFDPKFAALNPRHQGRSPEMIDLESLAYGSPDVQFPLPGRPGYVAAAGVSDDGASREGLRFSPAPRSQVNHLWQPSVDEPHAHARDKTPALAFSPETPVQRVTSPTLDVASQRRLLGLADKRAAEHRYQPAPAASVYRPNQGLVVKTVTPTPRSPDAASGLTSIPIPPPTSEPAWSPGPAAITNGAPVLGHPGSASPDPRKNFVKGATFIASSEFGPGRLTASPPVRGVTRNNLTSAPYPSPAAPRSPRQATRVTGNIDAALNRQIEAWSQHDHAAYGPGDLAETDL